MKKTTDFSPKKFVFAGYVTIFLVFGVFGTWAATAPLASAVIASGTISVESNRKTVQHFEGGIVSKIRVNEGQLVELGEVLIELDPTQAEGNYKVLETRLANLQATGERLLAESTDSEAVSFTDERMVASESINAEAMDLQKILFADRRQTKDNQTAILRVRIDQLNGVIEGLTLQLKSVDAQLTSIAGEIDRLREGNKTGDVSTNRLSQMTREMLQYEGKKGELLAEMGKFQQTISETELEISQERQKYIERASSEMRDIGDQLSEVYERFQLAKDLLNRTIVRSPVRGIVQNIQVHTNQGVIQAAQPILDIIPLDDKLVILAKVNPVDIDNLSAGLVAEVRLPTFSSKTTPTMYGKVIVVSQDVVEPKVQGDFPHYEARIEVEDEDVPAEIRGELLPGMPAEVIVPTGERTLAQYLAKPLTDSFYKSFREE